MIKTEKISTFELPDLVKIAYMGDGDLLLYYWGEDYNLEEAINATLNAIKYQENEGIEFNHYAVIEDEQEIGYISCFPNNLYSFGININRRTKEVLKEFWERVKEIMGDSFICMLFPQNQRAIEFLKKQGMQEVSGIEEDCVCLLNINN